MAKKRSIVEHSFIQEEPSMVPPAPFSSLNPIDSKNMSRGSIKNPSIFPSARAVRAIVGPVKSGGVDFSDIQEAIDSVSKTGGGAVFLLTGIHRPNNTFLNLRNNVYIIGEDPEKTIIDTTAMILNSGDAAFFGGGEKISTTGTIAATKDSDTITGTSTKFQSDGIREDDTIYINLHPYHVKVVASETSLTIKETYRGVNISSKNFAIYRALRNCRLENFTLIHNGRSTNDGIIFSSAEEIGIKNVTTRNFSGEGITIRGVFNFSLENCESYGNTGTGIDITETDSTDLINNGAIINCLAWGNDNRGINIEGNSAIRVLGCSTNGNNVGIRVASDKTHIGGCNSEFNAADGIVVDDADFCQIVGNNASSNGSDGISIEASSATSDKNVISSNNASSNAGFGILIEANCVENILVGNILDSNTSGDISDNGTNTVIITSGVGAAVDEAQTITKSLSAANIIAMNATPVEILATPGAGKMNIIEQIVYSFSHGGTDFLNGGGITIKTATTQFEGNNTTVRDIIQGAVDKIHNTNAVYVSDGTRVANENHLISNLTAAFDTGNGTMKLFIKYRTITL